MNLIVVGHFVLWILYKTSKTLFTEVWILLTTWSCASLDSDATTSEKQQSETLAAMQ
jgi:hypothetical protein